MKLSAPKKGTFIIALIILIVGIIAKFVAIPVISGFCFWLVVVSAVLLFAGCYCKGL